MTQIINPNDTGEIPTRDLVAETMRLDLDETARFIPGELRARLVGEATVNLDSCMTQVISPNLRSSDATEIIPVAEGPLFKQLADPSLTGEILALDTGDYPEVPKPVPPKPAGRHQLAAQRPGRGRHRAPAPLWTRLAVSLGGSLAAAAFVVVILLAVTR